MPFNRLIVFGFFGVLTGAVLPFVMVIGLLESTYLLNFIAYIASIVGIFLGLMREALHLGDERRKQDDWYE